MVRSTSVFWLALAAGCVDSFNGSNIQIDLPPATPLEASPGQVVRPGQLPANSHYSIVGIQEGTDGNHIFELAQFEVHPIVDLTSPCFIDVGDHVPHPGLHVTQFANVIAADTGIPDYMNPPASATEDQKIDAATAAQRMMNLALLAGDAGIHVVSSASTATYPGTAPDCTPSGSLIPPPMCTDDASNARRLELCQAAWSADPDFFEGTDRILTSPLNGITRGMVDGANPINQAFVGGAQFFVPDNVDGMDAFGIYYQTDGMPDPGTLLFFGAPTRPTRGVLHVHMTDPANSTNTAEMAIFVDLGSVDSHF